MTQDKTGSGYKKVDNWDPQHRALAPADALEGDRVVLWRGGRGGGVVALGTVVGTAPFKDDRRRLGRMVQQLSGRRTEAAADEAPSEEEAPPEPDVPEKVKVGLSFDRLCLGAPVLPDDLAGAGLGIVVKRARGARSEDARLRTLVSLPMPEAHWQRLADLVADRPPTAPWPASWNIEPGTIVPRGDVHDSYGGNRRASATSSALTPNTFLFLAPDQPTPDLAPRWDGDVLLAPGHRQDHDWLSTENHGVLSHLKRGIPLRVFQTRSDQSLYLGEFAVDRERPVERLVPTGTREAGRFLASPIVWNTNVPVFRLRQLSGPRPFTAGSDPFRGAPRSTVGLQVTSSEAAASARGHDGSGGPEAPAQAAVDELLDLLRSDPTRALGLDRARILATALEHTRRRQDLDRLRAAAETPGTKEAELQSILEGMTWVFGGEFLGSAARRALTVLDRLDLALLRPEGTLHGVELKQADVKNLLTGQRNHLIPGNSVHRAVGQVINYLVGLDEQRHTILAELGIDCRRASMTVVIGHSAHTAGGLTANETARVLWNYSSQLNRIDVITYDQLIDRAERIIDLTAPAD
ncbi:Shedu anti-phage system protein SduA domain-containing protein [Streptacidiphilus cavernicola]|uniref:Shedu anti-phage system protein SduA domain-containing protein n=1 Tax=Streptacidiphilus cavernicola TaxID=3342716 RepID=A0ABV6VP39_9ACTN